MRAAGLDVAVVGSGIAGLSAAWLLSRRHRVTLYEGAPRFGGHSNAVDVSTPRGPVPVDAGFIVYNENTCPNLTALFAHLGVPTKPSDMSFAVSLDNGQTEYAGTDLSSVFAQRANLFRPRFWAMLADLRRFYREAPALAGHTPMHTSLGTFLDQHRCGTLFRQDHLLPMVAAIWSASAMRREDYPAAHFIRFCDNHGLLRFNDRTIRAHRRRRQPGIRPAPAAGHRLAARGRSSCGTGRAVDPAAARIGCCAQRGGDGAHA
jgi:predicted NAD/FAD-binding protein